MFAVQMYANIWFRYKAFAQLAIALQLCDETHEFSRLNLWLWSSTKIANVNELLDKISFLFGALLLTLCETECIFKWTIALRCNCFVLIRFVCRLITFPFQFWHQKLIAQLPVKKMKNCHLMSVFFFLNQQNLLIN